MIQHEIIPPFSTEWYIYNTITILVITFIVLTGRKLVLEKKNQITLSIAGLFIFEFIVNNAVGLSVCMPILLFLYINKVSFVVLLTIKSLFIYVVPIPTFF